MAEETRIRELLLAIAVLPLDDRIEAAAIDLRRRGRLKLPDAIIGATAVVHKLRLLTFDERLLEALATHMPTL